MKLLFLFIFVAVLSALVFGAVGPALSSADGFEQIEPETSMVLADGAQLVLLRGDTLYNLDKPLESGCYRLIPPARGQTRGQARKVWPHCEGAR